MAEPMLPAAPERFSTTTDCPSEVDKYLDRTRARISVEPPGAHGTISVMGLSGQAARAAPGRRAATTASAATKRLKREENGFCMRITPLLFSGLARRRSLANVVFRTQEPA